MNNSSLQDRARVSDNTPDPILALDGDDFLTALDARIKENNKVSLTELKTKLVEAADRASALRRKNATKFELSNTEDDEYRRAVKEYSHARDMYIEALPK